MATFRRALSAGLLTLSVGLALAACGRASTDAGEGEHPDAPPTAVGIVRSVEPGAELVSVGFTPAAGYEYFEGTTFRIDQHTPGVDATQLREGDRIEVWTGLCRESFPVQCDVERIERASP